MRALALSPHGVLYLEEATDDAELDAAIATRIEAAFAIGSGAGLFHLGSVEVDTALPPAYAYFRDLARDVVEAVRAEPEIETLRGRITATPPREHLTKLAWSAPPMRGAEYVTVLLLEQLWNDALAFFREDIAAYDGSVASYLHAKNAAWNVMGRVFFHLAENRGNAEAPFAFLATYSVRASAKAKPQHRPLGKALEESAEKNDKRALLSLLVPVQRAAEKSALVASMVREGDIYHPLAWTPSEAYAFLREVPALEEAGVSVRVPNWWNASQPPRPQVRVAVGLKAPSKVGADALLDFKVDVTLDGEHLTPAEIRELLKSTSGLALFRGRWVEIDREKLGAVLEHWETAAVAAERDGLTFLEGMRLLAGVRDASQLPIAEERAWSRIEPGPWLAEALEGLRSPEGLAASDPGAALCAELRPYQRVGLSWLASLQAIGLGGCLADDMGLGKTIQVLALLLLRKKAAARPSLEDDRPHVLACYSHASLLIVPASLVANWIAEAARFAPSLVLRVAHPSARDDEAMAGKVDGADVVLTTYGTAARLAWMKERDWDIVVLDEAQAIKNPGARQTRAVKVLKARTRLALTGTPVENRLGDLWSLFDFLSPGLLGTATEFSRFTKSLAKRETAYAPLRELVRPYILRRLKTDKRVISDLPEKTEVRAFCSLTKKQAALYAEGVASLAKKLDSAEGIARRGLILAALMRFKQICNHPSQWLGDGDYAAVDSGKVARLRELCEPLAERQEKVLVFTQFREMTEPLAAFLAQIFGRPGLVLHGGTAVKKRKELVDAFQSDAGPPFFVLSLKAGGTGLNLTAASHVIHFDRWWNPAVENQATDRAFRIGQKRNVFVHKLVCRGTVEERIDELITSKLGISASVVDTDGEAILTEMSNEAVMKMVALDLRAVAEGD